MQAEADVSLDKVIEAVKSLNIGSKDLIGISSQQFGPSPNQTRFQYMLAFTVPFAKFKDTQEALVTARRTVLASGMDLQSSTILITSSEAAREAARQKLIPDLLAEARKKADQLAKAAGGSLGDILGIGEFTGGVGSSAFFGGFPSSLRFTHQMSVRFRLQ